METLEAIRTHLRNNLTPRRFSHSLSVERTAVKLAGQYNLCKDRCALAGLAHDICRELPADQLEYLAGKTHACPVLLHGEAGARKLRSRFGISDPSVLDAVRFHTSGNPDLDGIGKVVFAADYLEEGRKHICSDERERLFSMELDDMVLNIAVSIRSYLERENLEADMNLTRMIERLS